MKHYHIITSAAALVHLPPIKIDVVGDGPELARVFSKITYSHPLICTKAEDDAAICKIAEEMVPRHIPYMVFEMLGEGDKAVTIRRVRSHWVSIAN